MSQQRRRTWKTSLAASKRRKDRAETSAATNKRGDTYGHLLPKFHEPTSSLERELLRATGPSDERLGLRKKLAELQIRSDKTLRVGRKHTGWAWAGRTRWVLSKVKNHWK